jgi:phosphotriesterase-related protein
MSALLSSVCGPLGAGSLGRTLMHEHTTIVWPGAEQDYRRPPAAVTGQYSYYRMPWYDSPAVARSNPTSADDLAGNFIHEIERGIGDTGIRAGLIKVATDAGELSSYEERALRAAARAHRATGAGIITHTQDGTLGREQVAVFAEEGADLRRIVIGHNDTGDLAYLLDLLDTGVTLGYDRMGYEMFLPERVRMAALVTLLRMGYERQIVLSHDVVAGSPTTHVDLTYVPEVVVPLLLAEGVSQGAIDAMLIENPRRILCGVGA